VQKLLPVRDKEIANAQKIIDNNEIELDKLEVKYNDLKNVDKVKGYADRLK